MRRLGLRARVAALCAVLGLVVSACLSAVAVHFSDSYVHRLIDEMLRVESDYLRERYAIDGVIPRPRTKHYYAFVDGHGDAGTVPAGFSGLEPGLHEIADPHGERHVAVYDVNGHRLYVVLDIGLESVRERRLSRDLLALMLFGSALSAWLGWFLAGRAIEPVRRLANQVETLDPATHAAAPLAPDYSSDEVGVLAQAFDRYQQKLHEYVRRERAFTADASHELRTPLAVIRGAIEVLLDNGATDAATAVRLKRMQRGADELRDLLDALLVLARSDERAVEDRTPDLSALVDSLLRERADSLAEKHLRLEGNRDAAVAVAAPPRVLGIVIGNLLRAATQFAEGGVLRVQVAANALTVAHEGAAPAGDAAANPARLDTREHVLGLGMIRRVCERRGWLLDENVDAGGRAFVLRFG
ncbi:MAG TPA: HAMP domain-containing sensor histidine kinase [Rhodanobacteraceae bacterium]|nr:HAMP domain-containing sensor histidine kinase [Rhodanobacteraceae bacterium]